MFCTTIFVELNFKEHGLTDRLAQASNEEVEGEGNKNKAISCSGRDKNGLHHNVGLNRIQTWTGTSSLTTQGFSFRHMLCGNMRPFF